MNVNMLLYWMYVVRLNALQRCAWQKQQQQKQLVLAKLLLNKYIYKKRERERATPFIKSLLGASVPPTPTPAESDGWRILPSREQRGYIIKNLILVGTIIMLVALVRPVFLYLRAHQ